MALASGVKAMPEYAEGFKSFGNNFAVPALFLHMFPAGSPAWLLPPSPSAR